MRKNDERAESLSFEVSKKGCLGHKVGREGSIWPQLCHDEARSLCGPLHFRLSSISFLCLILFSPPPLCPQLFLCFGRSIINEQDTDKHPQHPQKANNMYASASIVCHGTSSPESKQHVCKCINCTRMPWHNIPRKQTTCMQRVWWMAHAKQVRSQSKGTKVHHTCNISAAHMSIICAWTQGW